MKLFQSAIFIIMCILTFVFLGWETAIIAAASFLITLIALTILTPIRHD